MKPDLASMVLRRGNLLFEHVLMLFAEELKIRFWTTLR